MLYLPLLLTHTGRRILNPMRSNFPPGFSFKLCFFALTLLLLGPLDQTKVFFLTGLLLLMLSYKEPRQNFKYLFKRIDKK